MSILHWLKGLFGRKKREYEMSDLHKGGQAEGCSPINPTESNFNLLIVRSSVEPLIKPSKSEDADIDIEVKIKSGMSTYPWRHQISETTRFERLPNLQELDMPGDEPIWFIKTSATAKNVNLGCGVWRVVIIPPTDKQRGRKGQRKDKSRKWKCFDEPKLITEFIKKMDQSKIQTPEIVDSPQPEEGADKILSATEVTIESSIPESLSVSEPRQVLEDSSLQENGEQTPHDLRAHTPNTTKGEMIADYCLTRTRVLEILKDMGYGNIGYDEDLKVVFNKIEEGIQNLRRQHTQSLNNVKSRDEEIRELTEQVEASRKKCKSAEDSLEKQKQILNDEISALRSKINKKSDEADSTILASKVKSLTDQISSLNSSISKLKKELEEKDRLSEVNAQRFEAKLTELKGEIEAKKAKLAEKTQLIASMSDSDTGKLAIQIQELQANLHAKDTEIESIRLESDHSAEELRRTLDAKMAELQQKEEVIKEKDVHIEERIVENEQLKQKQRSEIEKINTRHSAQVDDLKQTLSEKDKAYADISKELSDANKVISIKSKEVEKLEKDNTQLKEWLEQEKTTVAKTKEELNKTEAGLSDSRLKVQRLEKEVKNLKEEKSRLTEEKQAEIAEKTQLSETIKKDISNLLDTYQQAAKNLAKSVDSVFLKECNEDEELDTIETICAKIHKGCSFVAEEIDRLTTKQFASTIDLEKEFKQIIAKYIESYYFTEIARWWAYSRLPFLLDTSRDEGRSVNFALIDKAYAALEYLLALAGYRYQIPAIFVQNLKEGNLDDVTGREQLNLDYQVPNVRSHVEKIDREDCEKVVLDIVSLGYYKDNQLIKKTSVIVQ